MGGIGGNAARSRWALGSLLLAALIVGSLRGAADDRPNRSSTSWEGPPRCTALVAPQLLKGASVSDRLVIERRSTGLSIETDTVLRVPASIWEARVLRSPTATAGRRSEASWCILGQGPQFLQMTSNDGLLTVRTTSTLTPGATGWCRGEAFEVERRGPEVRVRSLRCPGIDGGLRGARVVGRTLQIRSDLQAIRVAPLPDAEAEGTMTWTSEPGEAAPSIELRGRISLTDRLLLRINQPDGSLDVRGWTLAVSLRSLASWVGEALSALLVLGAIVLCGGSRRTIARLASVVGALVIGLSVRVEPSSGYSILAASLVPVMALAWVALVVCARWWPTRLAAALGVGAAIWGTATSDGWSTVPIVPSVLISVGAVSAVAGVLVAFAAGSLRRVPTRDREVRWIPSGVRSALLLSVAYVTGTYLGNAVAAGDIAYDLARFAQDSIYIVAPFGLPLVAAFAGGWLAVRWPTGRIRWTFGMAIGAVWASVAVPGAASVFSIRLPLGLVALATAAGVLLHRRLPDAPVAREDRFSPSELASPVVGRGILAHGPTGVSRSNASAMLKLGALLSIVPVSYFLWGVLVTLPERTTRGPSAAFLLAALMSEAARWLVTAAVFGLAYRHVPGRSGPTKGALLAACWFGASALVEIVNRWSEVGTGRTWTFAALQLLLFLVALGTLYDYSTLVAAGGSWKDLQTVYGLDRTRDFVTVVVPVLVAVLAIIQQLISGSGLDFVRGVVENVPPLVGA